jgi:hypothetical protein
VSKKSFAYFGVLIAAAGAVVAVLSGQASADQPAVLYVNNQTTSNCSDGGTGSSAVPFCTISAAAAVVSPGQTVTITAGSYPEHVTITRSGTPDQPITFQTPSLYYAYLTGADGGLTIAGQHDVVIKGFRAAGTGTTNAIDISNSSDITLNRDVVNSTSAPVGIALTGVTSSTITSTTVTGMPIGIRLDASTTGVTMQKVFAGGNLLPWGNVGIDVFGSGNTIVSSTVRDWMTAGVVIEPGAANTVVANTVVEYDTGDGIDVNGGTATAITNNTVMVNCGTGIVVQGNASGTSVQNNVSSHSATTSCPTGLSTVDIRVSGAAMSDTIADYNTVMDAAGPGTDEYVWGTARYDMATFRSASGQAAHDIDANVDPGIPNNAYVDCDSANSAAPGVQPTDAQGRTPADDPNVANLGAGPISYLDRGAVETVGLPIPSAIMIPGVNGGPVTIDASASVPSWQPATIVSYEFDFSDGSTVTQSGPIIQHTYTYTDNGIGGAVYVHDSRGLVMPVDFGGPFTVIPTTLTLTPSASTVVTGQSVTLTARLTRADTGAPLSGDTIQLQWSTAPTNPTTAFLAVNTDATGTATFIDQPTASGQYTVSYDGYLGGPFSYGATTSAQATTAVTVVSPSSLTPTASASTVVSGHSVTVSAYLRTGATTPITGANVVLQQQLAGSTTWTTATTRTTDSTGHVSATVTPQATTTYRWVYTPGTAPYASSTSAGMHVTVTVVVAIKVSSTSIRYGTATTITTTITPHESGQTIVLQRYEGTKGWVTIATGHESSTGTASWKTTLPRGTDQLRILKPATTRYGASYSSTMTIKVS